MSEPSLRVVVEADGGARGNPGPAAYGALLRDQDSGRVLAEVAEAIGTASNNVAEYRGLIAGLELVAAHAPQARVEVRMDSKLVVEQMAGRWKVKHPDMRSLAIRARGMAPAGTVWTWVPRAENGAADRLVNAALDGEASDTGSKGDPLVGWRDRLETVPSTVVLLRHGVTASTEAKLFCGSGGSDPGLTERGEAQAQRAAGWLARRHSDPVGLDGVGSIDAIVSSPLRRCRETAQTAADELNLPVAVEDDLAEAAFGDWDGMSFAAVQQHWPDLLTSWLGDEDVHPPGGETQRAVATRVDRALRTVLADHRGGTVLLVSHVTPIKSIVRQTLDASAPLMHRMQLAPASLTVTQWWPDGVAVLRTFSYEPE